MVMSIVFSNQFTRMKIHLMEWSGLKIHCAKYETLFIQYLNHICEMYAGAIGQSNLS